MDIEAIGQAEHERIAQGRAAFRASAGMTC